MHPAARGPAEPLQAARDAYATRRWQDALRELQACDAVQALAPEDLARLAWSAGMLGRDDEQLAAFERLHAAGAAAGELAAAAYWAFFHGFRLLALQRTGQASAWLQRARRHAAAAGEDCAVHGYLLLPQVIRSAMGEDWQAAAAAAQEALATASRCGDVDLEALARCWLGRAVLMQGRMEEGMAMLDEAMLLALGDTLSPVVTGLVYCNLIASCRQVQAVDRAREWTAALQRWCNAQPQMAQFGATCELHRAEILALDGDWQQSVAAARAAARRSAGGDGEDVRAGAAYQEAEIHRLRGEWREAERCYAQAHRRGMDPQPGLALVRLAAGDAASAVAMLQRSLAAARPPIARARLLPALVEALLAIGAVDDVAGAAGQLGELACAWPSPALQAAAAQARGGLLLARGDAAGALPPLEQALATWLRLAAPYLAARVRVQLACACRLLGDAQGACMHGDAAREAFASLGAAPELRKLAFPPHESAPDAPAGLSPRELQVLRLVAAGHPNKVIARELGLSEKTVDRHLDNIFGKLEVHTRSAATAFAFRHRLVAPSA